MILHRRNLLALLAAFMVSGSINSYAKAQQTPDSNDGVTIEYIAHACFRITSPNGEQLLSTLR